MKALLVYPEFPDTFWSFKHALTFVRKPANSPPLGLLTVAAMLPPEWELRLVDLNVRPLADRDLAWADVAFVSSMGVQRPSAEATIARCKAAGLPVVAGGPLFTAQPEAFPEVDHLVLGEAEATLPAFLADLAAGTARRLYEPGPYPDVERSPVPRWDLADLRRYSQMSVQYSRGCPFDCEFCDITALFGHRPRTKGTPQMLAELDALCGSGWRGPVFFVDDNFIGNKKRLKGELLPALAAWRRGRRGMPFNTEASINLADDDDLMRMMVEAGFRAVFVGIETLHVESLTECNKKQNLHRDLVADARRMQQAGLEVQGGFILGFDHDPPGAVEQMVDYVQRTGIVTAMVGLLQALPGTQLHARLQREGRLNEERTGDNVDGTTNIVPLGSVEALRAGYRELLRRLYAPKPYYQRVRTFLRDYHPPRLKPRVDLGFVWEQGMAFARSIVRLGIVGRERVQYWKLLAWTVLRRPRHISYAVTFAIYGYHFRKICELHVDRGPAPA
ncbi:MAG: B12-binding domain-containing radical SAM protein [Gemmatimonadales bacterium]